MKVFGNKKDYGAVKKSAVPTYAAEWDAAKPQTGKSYHTKSIIALILSAAICVGTVWSILANVNATYRAANTETAQSTEPAASQQNQPVSSEPEATVAPANQMEGIYNILLVGTDEDDMQVDTLMIAQMNTNDGSTALLSIPRESLVFGNYSVPKISTVYGSAGKGEQGAMALVLAVKDIIGFEVDGYILMTPENFRNTVDELGGVDFEIPQILEESDTEEDWETGEQRLDGTVADKLMRFRDYEDENTQRAEVQQDFVCALLQQLQTVVADTTSEELSSRLEKFMLTDMDAELLASLMQQLLDCDLKQMQTYTLPGENVTIKGAEYYQLDEEAILNMLNDGLNPLDRDLTKYDIFIRTRDDFGSDYVPTVDSYTAWQQATETKPTTSHQNPVTSNTSSNETDPTDPIPDPPPVDEPTDPSGETPTDPPESSEPTDSTDPTDPTDPTESDTPTEPPTPSESETPTDPTPEEPPVEP